jgi:hypothetical protein
MVMLGDGAPLIPFTRYAAGLTQTQADSPKGYPAANAINATLQLTPLSAWGKP